MRRRPCLETGETTVSSGGQIAAPRPHRVSRDGRRQLLGPIVLVVAALTVSACSSTPASTASAGAVSNSSTSSVSVSPTASANVAPATARPVAGQCWNVTVSTLSGWTWDGSAAVDCSGPHNAETLFVGAIPKSAAAAYGTVPMAYEALVTTACSSDTPLSTLFGASVTAPGHWWTGKDPLPGVRSATPLNLAQTSYYFPSEQQWAAGERWFRCDVGSTTGPQGSPWRNATASFASVLASDPDFFRYCAPGKAATSGGLNVPVDVVNTQRTCTSATKWKFLTMVVLAKTRGETYPGATTVLTRTKALCPATPVARYSLPNKFEWTTNGIKSSDCWQYVA